MTSSRKLKVAVVGTGLSSFGALVALLQRIEFLDVSVLEASIGIDSGSTRPFKRFSKTMPVDASNNFLNKPNNYPPIYSPGGWSRFWGATVAPKRGIRIDEVVACEAVMSSLRYAADSDGLKIQYPLYGQPEERGAVSDVVQNFINRVREHRGYQDQLLIGKSRLAIYRNNHTPNGGGEHAGESSEFSVVNTFDQILRWVDNGSLTLKMNTVVSRYEVDSAGVSLWIREFQGEELCLGKFDIVFAGIGIFESARLIEQSHEEFRGSSFFTRETPMSIVPAILVGRQKKGSRKQQECPISLSEAFLFLKHRGECYGSAQIYSLTKDLIKHLPFYLQKIPRMIRNRLLIFMWFESNADSLIELDSLQKNQCLNLHSMRKESKSTTYRRFRRILQDIGVLTLPVNIFRQPPGASYHYDGLWVETKESACKDSRFKRVVDGSGQVINRKDNRFFFLGAANQQEQILGPSAIDFAIKSYQIVKSRLSAFI